LWRNKHKRSNGTAKIVKGHLCLEKECVGSDLCLTPSQHFVRCIIARTSYISMRRWCCPICTRQIWFL